MRKQAAVGVGVVFRHGGGKVGEQFTPAALLFQFKEEGTYAFYLELGKALAGKGEAVHAEALAKGLNFMFEHSYQPSCRASQASSRSTAASTASCMALRTFMRPASSPKSAEGNLRELPRSS